MTFKENIISRNERIVSTILCNINFTNKALSLIARVSISTIKRWKRKILNEKGKIDISHKNMGNQNAKKYNDELILELGKIYEKNAKITGGNIENESCSYLTLSLFHKNLDLIIGKNDIKISYSNLVKRLKKEGFASKYATKTGRKEAKKNRRKKEMKEHIYYEGKLTFSQPKKKQKFRFNSANNYKYGDIVEIDGCTHYYFNNEIKSTCLMAVDVGTNKVLDLHFEEGTETLNGYQTLLENIFNKYGYPRKIFADNRMNFWHDETSNAKTFLEVKNRGIEFLTSSNPTFKSHVERKWDTFQKNIPFFLKLNNIDNVKLANEFKEKIIEKINSCCSIKEKQNVFMPITNELDKFFDLTIKRTINNGAVKYQNKWYMPIHSETNKRVNIVDNGEFNFVIGTDMKLYFRSHSKRYKAIEVEDKRYEFMINFAYRKKINMNIEEAKKLAELITSTYYVHSIIEKKISILKSLEDKDHFFKDEMLILNEIFEDLKNEREYLSKIINF